MTVWAQAWCLSAHAFLVALSFATPVHSAAMALLEEAQLYGMGSGPNDPKRVPMVLLSLASIYFGIRIHLLPGVTTPESNIGCSLDSNEPSLILRSLAQQGIRLELVLVLPSMVTSSYDLEQHQQSHFQPPTMGYQPAHNLQGAFAPHAYSGTGTTHSSLRSFVTLIDPRC